MLDLPAARLVLINEGGSGPLAEIADKTIVLDADILHDGGNEKGGCKLCVD